MKTLLVPPKVGQVRFDLGKTFWLWGMLVGALPFGLPAATLSTCAVGAALTFLTLCVGHSVGLHRGVIHRTYQASPLVQGGLLYLFVLMGLGGPLSWARLHAVRDYWQNRLDCPPYFAYRHSLARDFFWNLHLGFRPSDDRALALLPAGIFEDRWLRFLERTWPLHVMGSFAILGLTLGPAGVAVAGCCRVAASILGHWAVGYMAHAWGEHRYTIAGATESGTNVWALGVLSFGEGFHNNHHAFPASARMGMKPLDLDLGWLTVLVLEQLGLVKGVSASDRIGTRGAEAKPLVAAPQTLAAHRSLV